MVRKIYTVFCLNYIAMTFSVDLVQGGFCEPRRVLRYASSGEQKPYSAQDLRRNLLFYISNPFSVKIWCKTGFPSPDAYYGTQIRVRKSRIMRKIYAVIFGFIYQCRLAQRFGARRVFVSPDAYYGTQVRVRKIRMVRKIYAVICCFIYHARLA